MFNLSRRTSTDNDRDFCFKLRRQAYEDLVTRQFGGWDDNWQRLHFKNIWIPGKYQILEISGLPVGIFCIEAHVDHIFISEIQILPEYQSRGIGTFVIAEELEKADSMRIPVRLQVAKMNRARNLYERLGFLLCGETETHFQMLRTGTRTMT